MIRAITNSPVPTIAEVQGGALGAGADLMLACDIRVASQDAWFQESWIRPGLITALGGAHRLTRMAGPGNALAMLLTAERVAADRGLACGIFQLVVPPEELEASVATMAAQIAQADRSAVETIKALVRQDLGSETLEQALNLGLAAQVRLIQSAKFGEALAKLET